MAYTTKNSVNINMALFMPYSQPYSTIFKPPLD